MIEKKVFFISVIDKADSLNRKYSSAIRDLIHTKCDIFAHYQIIMGNENDAENLYDNLDNAIIGNDYEGYIILLDCLDDSRGLFNPNVMFEFGAIKYLDKPFVIVSSHDDPSCYPFDIKPLNIVHIPNFIVDKIIDFHNNGKLINSSNLVSKLDGTKKDELSEFLSNLEGNYTNSLKKHQSFNSKIHITNEDIIKEINEVKSLVKNIGITAEYIDGESAAFKAVKEAVEEANTSLHTSRFSNQSIVSSNATEEQEDFMKALYRASKELKQKADRIICNNDPLKWLDIYQILYYGGNGSKVYIRKSEYSIHFELVVINDMVAFIHFYQPDHAEKSMGDDYDHQIEKINSTLKIRGYNICKKLSNIFNRLHHKDFDVSLPHNPSRTLLGIPFIDEVLEKDLNNGCFFVSEDIPEIGEFPSEKIKNERKQTILSMFKKAYREWDWSDRSNEDRLNMLVGISLIEGNVGFIDENKPGLSDEVYNNAKNLFERKIKVV